MSTMSERIKTAMQKAGLSYGELSKLTGIPKAALQRYGTGETAKVPINRIEEIARHTGVAVEYLVGWDDDTHAEAHTDSLRPVKNVFSIHTKKVPLLGSIACGEPIYANEEHGEFVLTSDTIDADFCLRAQGDSMSGARILDGDIVFIRKQEEVDNGQIAAVLIGDEATLKRVYYYPEKSKLVLNPENPAYEPLVYVGAELDEVRILGRAVAFQSVIR